MNAVRCFKLALSIGLLSLVLGGCATSPPAHYYTLAPLQPPAVRAASVPAFSVAVGPVIAPDLLQRPQIATRTSEHQVSFSDFHKWAGALADETKRVLVVNLNALLAGERAAVTTDDMAIDPDFRVVVNINRFDGRPGGSVWLNAVWTLKEQKGKMAVAVNQAVIEEPVGGQGYPDLVSAQSRAIGQLSRAIAAGIATARKAP
ncbi:MAG TPA: PqiC family protein [Desulfobacterales bacterium]|nr:PqiC family protein [Desulfobacterales bacterium]